MYILRAFDSFFLFHFADDTTQSYCLAVYIRQFAEVLPSSSKDFLQCSIAWLHRFVYLVHAALVGFILNTGYTQSCLTRRTTILAQQIE